MQASRPTTRIHERRLCVCRFGEEAPRDPQLASPGGEVGEDAERQGGSSVISETEPREPLELDVVCLPQRIGQARARPGCVQTNLHVLRKHRFEPLEERSRSGDVVVAERGARSEKRSPPRERDAVFVRGTANLVLGVVIHDEDTSTARA